MKGALLSIEEECYMHMLALCFFYYLHIHTSNKQIIVVHTKMGSYTAAHLVTLLGSHH